jgi:phosphinothricin acetyltransferase
MASEAGGLAVRAVRLADAADCLSIYRPNVTDSVVSFEHTPPDLAEFRARIERTAARHPWLVAERAGSVVGYAYASEFRSRAAYRWCCETSVYVAGAARGGGVATSLYTRLFAELVELGYTEAIGVITLPNAPSVALHERLGFVHAGTLERCGWKRGGWHAVGFWQRPLATRTPTDEPRTWSGLAAGR